MDLDKFRFLIILTDNNLACSFREYHALVIAYLELDVCLLNRNCVLIIIDSTACRQKQQKKYYNFAIANWSFPALYSRMHLVAFNLFCKGNKIWQNFILKLLYASGLKNRLNKILNVLKILSLSFVIFLLTS